MTKEVKKFEKIEVRIKEYLSHSQFRVFNTGREAYIKAYIYGYVFVSKYMKFGSKIHDVLEHRKAVDKDGRIALEIEPRGQRREVIMLSMIGGVPIYVKMDVVYKSRTGYGIRDVKTSLNGWTQKMADRSKQLTFYAAVLAKEKNIPINKIRLWVDCLETSESKAGKIHLTGRKQIIETSRTQDDVDILIPEIRYAWVEIGKIINKLIKKQI